MSGIVDRPRRPSIKEIARETGYSRATVDRALNGRGRVHPSTLQLIRAAHDSLLETECGRRASDPESATTVELVLHAGRGLNDQLLRAGAASRHALEPYDLYQSGEEAVHRTLERLCRNPERPLVAIVKNDARTAKLLADARRRGKRVIAMVSDLELQSRDAYVGIDNRMAGQTAAFIIGNLLRGREERVGAVLGSTSFRCHEDREIGFRSHLRSAFPRLAVCDAVKGDDSPEKTFQAVRKLMENEPGLAAIYNIGGGNNGLADAVRDAGRAGDIFVITHETNAITIPLVEDGVLHFLIGQDSAAMLEQALDLAVADAVAPAAVVSLTDFFVFTRFNVTGAAGN